MADLREAGASLITVEFAAAIRVGEMAMTRRLAKIIQFGAKRRHVHARVSTTGELMRVVIPLRPRDNDEGPRAA